MDPKWTPNGSVCVDSHRSEPLVATGGADGVVCLYDTAQRKALSKMKGHDGAVHRVRLHPRAAPVSCLSFSENGFYLATGGAEGARTARLKNIHTIDVGAPVRSAAFDFSGQFLAAAAGTTSLYETKSWASLAQHKAAASGVSFGAAASLLVAAGPDGKLTLYGSA
ncbi:hypothetical protein EMIHUDRAFT_212164 [Emiliania huxleyi CCMP1516]|uniref:Pre-mRNA-processing factor 19 n=2 Tax=Emiliania huxleyi TaxID=2903 RepID=A0A0D3ISA5_EMIH1|nr:hypothetical protein EMIHUDRAFT_212164 [Emiliania huxleyi CCMP1516]EOD14140.1 hypothetical protein EMIHUDRAFT_212164 [Emiliania huxleyi CCMP1516]|eukprot:XP_005766569.1 hypothetical protein EMIHUDRAFT_212164 [Emiliania huxleyi CCMP1516]